MRRRRAALVAAVLSLCTAATAQTPVAADLDPRITSVVGAISEARLERLLRTLVGFGTRNTLSDTSSPTRGIGAARQWIFDELTRTSPRLQVSLRHAPDREGRRQRPDHAECRAAQRRRRASGTIGAADIRERPLRLAEPAAGRASSALNRGTTAPPARTLDPNVDAPGANDDGSGTVLVMELARVFAESRHRLRRHARVHRGGRRRAGADRRARARAAGQGGSNSGAGGVQQRHRRRRRGRRRQRRRNHHPSLLGGPRRLPVASAGHVRRPGRRPLRTVAQGAAAGTARSVLPRRRPHRVESRRCRRGRLPRVARELRAPARPERHARGRLVCLSRAERAGERGRDGGAGARSAAARGDQPARPANPRSAALGYDARLRWTASPGATGYRVVWREAWAQDWQHEASVGNVTEYVLPKANIDDFVYGVAAIGPGGHESTVSAYIPPPPTY